MKLEMVRKAGRTALKLIDSAFPEPHRCLACNEAITKEAPGIKLCRNCSSALSAAIVFGREREGSKDGPGSAATGGHRRTFVRLDPNAAPLADKLLAGGKAGLAALSKVVAHAVPFTEYMGVDSVYTVHARGETGKDASLNALGRALATAFACRYMGNAPLAGSSWQDESIARYSGRSLGKGWFSSYPIVLSSEGQALQGTLDKLAVHGAVKIMKVEIWRYHGELDGV